jgi:hypothetical protein
MFEQFLISENILLKFIQEFRMDTTNFIHAEQWIERRGRYSPDIAVYFAFDWENTQDGYDYWENIALKWKLFMQEHNIETNRRVYHG